MQKLTSKPSPPCEGFGVWIFVCCLLFVFCCLPSYADFADIALKQGVGVREMAMGAAGTAIANDASALFYNPANLADAGLAFTMANPDTSQKQTNSRVNMLKLGYLGYLTSTNTDANSPADQINYSVLGFGNRSSYLNWGLSYKEMNWTISGANSSGWTGDLGLLMRISPYINLGFLAQDVLSSKNPLVPATARIGLGLNNKDKNLILATDLEYARGSQLYGHLGIELTMAKGFALRAGLNRDQLTAGCGLDFGVLVVDYAIQRQANDTYVQRVEAGLKYIPEQARPFSIIKPKEYALIDVAGALKGGRSEYSLLGGYQLGLDSLLENIRNASKDPMVDGLMIKVGGFDGGLGGMAVVQELRDEVQRFKKQGKKVVAYLEGSGVGEEYYLASVADKIVAPPGAAIGGFGKSIAIYRTSGLFEKLGIEWQVFNQGKYKDAFGPYNENMTKEQREMVEGIVSDLYRTMLNDIAKDRKIKMAKMRGLDSGIILTASEAKKKGLIDEIGYYNNALTTASKLAGGKDEPASLIAPDQISPDDFFLSQMFGIAVIEIDGELVAGEGGENLLFGGRYVGSQTIAKYIRQASDDIFVKAIILRVNSPGGDAIAAGEIYQAMQYARKKDKKIIASLGNIAASGGYYIACAADKIVSDKSSITGSIGVIGYFPLHQKLMKKAGLKADVIKEGKYADMYSGLRKMTPEELKIIENLQQEAYHEFLSAVITGRKLATAEVENLAQGKIYTGSQALEVKLVDQLGSFSDAIDLAKTQAKVAGEPRLIFYHQPSMFFDFGQGMLGTLGFSGLFPAKPQYKLSLPESTY